MRKRGVRLVCFIISELIHLCPEHENESKDLNRGL